jgi:hypothetical protein
MRHLSLSLSPLSDIHLLDYCFENDIHPQSEENESDTNKVNLITRVAAEVGY